MKIALAQLQTSPDKEQNLQHIASMAGQAAEVGAGILLVPECAMVNVEPDRSPTDVAESLDGPFAGALSSLAATHRMAVLAGMYESIAGSPEVYNTIVAFGPDGFSLGAYRKIHLYDAFGYRESDTIEPGSGQTLVFTLDGLTFGVQTCYDLRFPEITRHLVAQGADCVLVPTAWVQGPLKESHWELLLRARAIENTVYVAGAGLVGIGMCGSSMLVDPMGVPISRAGERPAVLVGEIQSDRIREVREANPSLANMRPDVYCTWTLEPVPS